MSDSDITIVFYANPDYYPSTMNAVKLFSRKYKVTVICRNVGKVSVEYPDNVEVQRTGKFLSTAEAFTQPGFKKISKYLSFLFSAVKAALSQKSRCVIAYDMHAFAAALFIKLLNPKINLIYHCHDPYDMHQCTFFMKIIKHIELRFARNASMNTCPNATRAEIFAHEACLDVKPLVIPNTCMLQKDKPKGRLRSLLAFRGISEAVDQPIILHQGTVCENQQSLNIIRSMKYWQKGIMVFIGQIDPSVDAELKKEINELGLSNRVFFLKHVPYQQLLSYTVDADIGLALYKPANISLKYHAEASCKLNEYLACGVAVIAGSNSDCKEVYGTQKWLTLVDPENPAEIADGINAWLSSPAKLEDAKKAALGKHLQDANFEKSFKPISDFVDLQLGK